jgi:hypothetical protein
VLLADEEFGTKNLGQRIWNKEFGTKNFEQRIWNEELWNNRRLMH